MSIVNIAAKFLLTQKKAELRALESGINFFYFGKHGEEYGGWVQFYAEHLYEVGFSIARLDPPGQRFVSALPGFGRLLFLMQEEEGGVAELVWQTGMQYNGASLGLASNLSNLPRWGSFD